jgi:hypothetical protein
VADEGLFAVGLTGLARAARCGIVVEDQVLIDRVELVRRVLEAILS